MIAGLLWRDGGVWEEGEKGQAGVDRIAGVHFCTRQSQPSRGSSLFCLQKV